MVKSNHSKTTLGWLPEPLSSYSVRITDIAEHMFVKWWPVLLRVALPILFPPTALGFYAWHKASVNGNGFLANFWFDAKKEELLAWLAVSGILYAVFHETELIKQTTHLESQVSKLEMLEKSLSTQRLPFPRYLPEIRTLAERAKHLDILADFLDFGSFFSPPEHRKAHDTVCNVANVGHSRVRMLICGFPEPIAAPDCADLRAFANNAYYPQDLIIKKVKEYCLFLRSQEEKDFANSIPRLKENNAYEEFSKNWFFQGFKPTTTDIDGCIEVCSGSREIKYEEVGLFRTLLQMRQLYFAEQLKVAKVDIRAMGEPHSIFFWHKYEEEHHSSEDQGIFTFSMAARGSGQLGYITSDSDIVRAFGAMFKEKWEQAKKESECNDRNKWLHSLNRGFLLR